MSRYPSWIVCHSTRISFLQQANQNHICCKRVSQVRLQNFGRPQVRTPASSSSPRRSSAPAVPNAFSRQINMALSLLTSKFGDEINEAYVTAPATQKRARETESEKMDKMRIIEQNQKAIMVDMSILAGAKQKGTTPHDATKQFLGFQQLGGADYLSDDDDDDSDYEDESESDDEDESDDESDDDEDDNGTTDDMTIGTKAMVDERMRSVHRSTVSNDDDSDDSDDDSDYDDDDDDDEDSDDDSDYDDDDSDESSIGSYSDLMADMEESMGVHVPADFKVKSMLGASAMSLLSLPDCAQDSRAA